MKISSERQRVSNALLYFYNYLSRGYSYTKYMIIDGRKIAEEIIHELMSRPKPSRFFGAVLVGDDPASLNFLKQKEKVAKELGIEFRLYRLSSGITTDELRREIARLAGAKTCGGFIVQLPLPEKINMHYALNAIPKEKDVDMLSESALGGFYSGRHKIVPPSVGTVEEIVRQENLNLRELSAVLVGAGFLIGKPVGFWLQNRVAELTVFDEHAKHLREKLKNADLVVSGAGVPNLFSADDLKDGAVVIDFGFNNIGGKICGDFNVSGVKGSSFAKATAGRQESRVKFTPTPGGTGPILVAKLFENFYALNSSKQI